MSLEIHIVYINSSEISFNLLKKNILISKIEKTFRSQGESEMVDELNKKIEKFLTDNSATPDQVKYFPINVFKV